MIARRIESATSVGCGGRHHEPQSLNRYAYVLNNPTTLTDPLGLCGETYTTVSGQGYRDAQGNLHFTNVDSVSTAVGDPCPVLPFDRFAVQNWIRTISFYIQLERAMAAWRERQNALTPERIAALGLRTADQTFGQCMEQNASNYSVAGVADFAFGANGEISNSLMWGTVGGNQITGTYFAVFGSSEQSARNAFTTGAGSAGNVVSTAMGSPLTYGRRTTAVMALNLASKPGGPPLALSSAARGAKGFIGKLGTGSFKLAVDIGFTLAEAVGCSIHE